MMHELFSNLSITSNGFAIFVFLVLVIYYLAPYKAQNYVLLTASCLFCLTWDWKFSLILIVSSLINYLSALKIDASNSSSRVRWLWLGIVINLGLLFFYKYFDQTQIYFFKALSRIGFAKDFYELNLLQPIGISFYTLQAISYLIDVYRRQIPANNNFLEVSLYLAWFPKLLAGPLERAGNFFKQLRADIVIDNAKVIENFTYIFIGLARKLIIADPVARLIPQHPFKNPENFNMPDLFFWWVVFAFVIYNDFAGYTGIARGVSGLFGLQLSPNFEQPFFSTSYIDFWNRWHISLSNWLRDYIYMPVSRIMLRHNPSGRYWPNLVIPPLVTMIVSGIWHGLAPHFIVWGILNGALQGFERIQKLWQKKPVLPLAGWKIFVNAFSTIFILLLINVPFKLDLTQTLAFWGQLFSWDSTLLMYQVFRPLLAIGLSLFIDNLEKQGQEQATVLHLPQASRVFLLAAGTLLLFLTTREQAATPFIYQGF